MDIEDNVLSDFAPLVSVIVPIYNVEDYVRKCLDSLKEQELKQIEVICVDDGSTDESGSIAEEYKNKQGWPCFKVVHTNNRGLSAARNRGIDEAKADYLMFVDGDDWVDSKFCLIPWSAARENKADLVIFGADHWKNGKRIKKNEQVTPVGLIDKHTAYEFEGVVVWNKLYKRSLFNCIRFPEGHNCEDIATTYKFVHMAETIILLNKRLYHHVYRKGSITHTTTKSNKEDIFISRLERRDYFARLGYPVQHLDALLVGAGIGYLSMTFPNEDDVWIKAKNVVDSSVGIPRGLSLKQKTMLIAWRINPNLFYLISKAAGRM